MSRIAAMVQTICELAGDHIHDYAYNKISPWWQEVRELLLESKQFSGLLVAIVCKTVASNLWRSRREVIGLTSHLVLAPNHNYFLT